MLPEGRRPKITLIIHISSKKTNKTTSKHSFPNDKSSEEADYVFIFRRDWYDNASCRHWFRRRPLEGAFTHPSKMVYPPGERYSPPPLPTGERVPHKPRTWEDQLPTRSPLNYEIGGFKSESQ